MNAAMPGDADNPESEAPTSPYLSLTGLAQAAVSGHAAAGDTLVDATVGNGHDTLFLASIAGPRGRVFGFDIQSAALQAAHDRLRAKGLEQGVTLIQKGHEHLEHALTALDAGHPAAIMFNLGYLPGGAKHLHTLPATTAAGLEQGLRLLRPRGVLTVMAYPGHEGGAEESRRVAEMLEALDASRFRVERHSRPGTRRPSPLLWVVRKE